MSTKQTPLEELRNQLELKIAIWITKAMGNKEGQGTEMLNELVTLITQRENALLERVGKEVIGKDEKFNGVEDMRLSVQESQNMLRAQQREKLAALRKENVWNQ